MKELVIFDLDGTLLNTIADLAISTNYALHRCGFPKHREEEYFHFVGNGITKLFERALPEECRSSDNVSRVRRYFWNITRYIIPIILALTIKWRNYCLF